MKRTLNLVLASALLVVWGAGRAATVNDGSTTTGLQRFANANNFLGDVEITTLTVGPSGYLTAAQTAELAFPPMETTWYATDTAPTSGVYRVAADFQPAQVDSAHQGGVMGWISLSTSNGVVLKINPSGSGTLELSVVNPVGGIAMSGSDTGFATSAAVCAMAGSC